MPKQGLRKLPYHGTWFHFKLKAMSMPTGVFLYFLIFHSPLLENHFISSLLFSFAFSFYCLSTHPNLPFCKNVLTPIIQSMMGVVY